MPGVEGTESGLHGRLTAIVRATPHLIGPYRIALVLGGELPIKGVLRNGVYQPVFDAFTEIVYKELRTVEG